MITPEHQRIIATWASLKAMVAEFTESGRVTTHHSQRKYLKDHLSPPQTWAIWIGPYLRGSWAGHWLSTPFLYHSPKQELRWGTNVRATHYNGHISTQVVGQLFIHVIRSPARRFVQGWRFSAPDKGSLFRIWPPTDTIIKWPGQFMSDRDADYVATAMHNFLIERIGPTLAKAVSDLNSS
ncbi:hypothetical protein [Bradyrhizobium sp. SRS-191]|uniref:hypothetical protein n=1 Tax=Bradyrhizobium sp. SRS-191 TaxID=2962606 RepID=UPI00211DDBAC|nr:hypothetical protein [Bradyrhizobium sp. SRS-191]